MIESIAEPKPAQEVLLESQNRYRATFESAPVGMVQTDMTGQLIECNRAMRRMIGYNGEELARRDVAEIVHPDDMLKLAACDRALMTENRDSYHDEVRFLRQDGGVVQTNMTASLIRDVSGDPAFVVMLIEDITARKRAEAEVASLARFPAENPNPVIRITATGEVLYCNLPGATLLDTLAGADGQSTPDEWQPIIAQALQRDESIEGENQSGDRVFSCNFVPVSAAGYVNVYGIDITERTRAEEALRASEAGYRGIFDHAPIGIVRNGLDGRLIESNQAVQDMLGYSHEELRAVGWKTLIHPDDTVTMTECWMQCSRAAPDGWEACPQTEARFIGKDGRVLWLGVTPALARDPSGTPQFLMGMMQDITARKQAEEALRESEARYRAIFDQAPIGINRVSLDGLVIETNSTLQQMLGYSADELRGLDFAEITHPDDLAADDSYFRGLVSGKRDHYLFEKRYHRQDGQVLWATVSASLVRDTSGAPQFVIGAIEDITERKRAEAALREHEVHRHELARARQIQQELLPGSLTGWPARLELAARFRAARETSGDFYDVLELTSGSPGPLQIAVGDVAGKGLPAALVMSEAVASFRAIARQGTAGLPGRVPSPAATMRQVSGLMHQFSGPNHFAACALAVVEPPGAGGGGPRPLLANAAQVPPLLCRAGKVVELEPPGERLPLGVLSEPDYEDLSVALQSGDVVVFASDGLPEAPALPDEARAGSNGHVTGGAAGEYFGFERLTASAAYWASDGRDAEAITAGLWADLAAWCGADSQHDDMTLLVLRVPPLS